MLDSRPGWFWLWGAGGFQPSGVGVRFLTDECGLVRSCLLTNVEGGLGLLLRHVCGGLDVVVSSCKLMLD